MSKSSNYYTIALISHASKIMLKILQARLQQYMNSMDMNLNKLQKIVEEEPVLLQSIGPQRFGHNLATEQQQ